MRTGWLLGLLFVGCGPSGTSSTGVGNPGISLQLSVYTDDEVEGASAGAGGADSDEPLPRDGVLTAQLNVGALRFRPCDSPDDFVNVPGPFVIDLIKRSVTPAIPAVAAVEGGYCGIDAPLRRALRPAELLGRSLLFEGVREDGVRFVLFSDMTAMLRLRARPGQVWDAEQTPDLLWAFRPRRWLSKAEVNSAEAADYQGTRAIVIDVDRHPLLYWAVRARVAGRSALYPDLNENGVLDGEERALPLGEGLEDAD